MERLIIDRRKSLRPSVDELAAVIRAALPTMEHSTMSTDIEWTPSRYPCDDPENGPARRNPVNGCVICRSRESGHYTFDGMCDVCSESNEHYRPTSGC
jgi:hypothetical protein